MKMEMQSLFAIFAMQLPISLAMVEKLKIAFPLATGTVNVA